MKFKWSQFVFFVESKNRGKIIVRNTLNGATVVMPDETKKTIDSTIGGKAQRDIPPGYLKTYMQTLSQLRILVPAAQNEKKEYVRLFRESQRNEEETFSLYLVVTRNCQLKCLYCFEQGGNREGQMNVKTASNVARWCRDYLDTHRGCKKLKVVLYGGEPLLNTKAIKYIIPKIYRISAERSLLFQLDVVTNGELLSPGILSFLGRYHLTGVQITLDGPKRVHDQRRARKDGAGTFDRIVGNIIAGFRKHLLEKVQLDITFDRQNIRSIPALLDFLVARDLQARVEVSFTGTFPVIREQLNRKTPGSHFATFGFRESEIAARYLWLWKEAKKRGFTVLRQWMTGPVCTASKKHSVVIEPDGTFLKCPLAVGQQEFGFGNVARTKETIDPRFNTFAFLEECLSKDCPWIALCNGGCRLRAYLSSGSFSQPHCRKGFIEKVNKGLAQLNFK